MNGLQESDQVTYSFLFIITPLEIVSTKSIKNLKKSLLLKLGNRTQKTSQLNKPIEMPVDVLYSKTLKKYCPIKGIIKVYDINLDGSEVISSVGGFQTEEILNQQKNNVIIDRDVGTSKIKMKIQIRNMGVIKGKPEANEKKIVQKKDEDIQPQKYPMSRSRTKQSFSEVEPMSNLQKSRQQTKDSNSPSSTPQLSQSPVDESKKPYSYQYFKRSEPLASSIQPTVQTPPSSNPTIDMKKRTSGTSVKSQQPRTNRINDKYQDQSLQKRSSQQSQGSFTESYLRQKQNEELGQMLVEQRRNTLMLQDKIAKYHQKITLLKRKLNENEKEKDDLLDHFQKISDGLEIRKGRVLTDSNDKEKSLTLRYKQKNFDKTFNSFIEYMLYQLSKTRIKLNLYDNDHNDYFEQQNTNTSNKISNPIKDSQYQSQIKHLNEELSRKTNEIFSLRAKEREKGSSQIRFKSKQRQCMQLQTRLKQLQILKKTLKEENSYLKQKDETMQAIISQKQNEIQMLKQELTEIELQYKQMSSTLKNDACEIEQLKQEVSNLNQIIEEYREKYGDLKNVKNRALENQLKECLIWIDQQTRELEMSDFAQETEPSHSHNVSEIIKNIQLEGASREEMNSIKQELAGLIKRIDNFLCK